MLHGLLVAGEDGEEGGGELGEVVEHLQGHAHLVRVLHSVQCACDSHVTVI